METDAHSMEASKQMGAEWREEDERGLLLLSRWGIVWPICMLMEGRWKGKLMVQEEICKKNEKHSHTQMINFVRSPNTAL